MNGRRNFLRFAGAAAVPVAVAGVAKADDGNGKDIVGAWNTVHTLPPVPGFPPNFREFISFADGGAVQETNNLLHTHSNLNFSIFGLPSAVNASDGKGNWTRTANGKYHIVFRKFLFDDQGHNFADFRATGDATANGSVLSVSWQVDIVFPNGATASLGPATSSGTRLA